MMLDLHSISADPDPKTILRIEEVLHRTGLKRTMLYGLIAEGKFPKQVSLGARAVGWYEDKVEGWIRNCHSVGKQGHQVRLDEMTTPALKAPSDGIPRGSKPKADQVSQNTASCEPAPIGRKDRGEGRTPALIIKNAAAAEARMISPEELRHLRDENARLKRLIADLILKNDMLQSSNNERAASM